MLKMRGNNLVFQQVVRHVKTVYKANVKLASLETVVKRIYLYNTKN